LPFHGKNASSILVEDKKQLVDAWELKKKTFLRKAIFYN
jgi:hypothetical protein